MTAEQFCYWLQGRAEMQPSNPPSMEEWLIIGAHRRWVFKKEMRAKSYIQHIGDLLPSSPTIIPNDVPNDVSDDVPNDILVTSPFDKCRPGEDEFATSSTVTC